MPPPMNQMMIPPFGPPGTQGWTGDDFGKLIQSNI